MNPIYLEFFKAFSSLLLCASPLFAEEKMMNENDTESFNQSLKH